MKHEKCISVAVKPEDRPSVTGFKSRHRVGDTLQMTCYINNTFPAANLTWFVTGKMVREKNLDIYSYLPNNRTGQNKRNFPENIRLLMKSTT